MSVEIVGLDKLIKELPQYVGDLSKEIDIALTKNGVAVQRYARANHRFTSRSGRLEASVTQELEVNSKSHQMSIFLNDSHTTTKSKKGYRSYGTFIHEGTYQGYKKSDIAPPMSHSISKSGNGWQGDPFLARAIHKKWHFDRDIIKIMNKLDKKYSRAK